MCYCFQAPKDHIVCMLDPVWLLKQYSDHLSYVPTRPFHLQRPVVLHVLHSTNARVCAVWPKKRATLCCWIAPSEMLGVQSINTNRVYISNRTCPDIHDLSITFSYKISIISSTLKFSILSLPTSCYGYSTEQLWQYRNQYTSDILPAKISWRA